MTRENLKARNSRCNAVLYHTRANFVDGDESKASPMDVLWMVVGRITSANGESGHGDWSRQRNSVYLRGALVPFVEVSWSLLLLRLVSSSLFWSLIPRRGRRTPSWGNCSSPSTPIGRGNLRQVFHVVVPKVLFVSQRKSPETVPPEWNNRPRGAWPSGCRPVRKVREACFACYWTVAPISL